MAAILTAEDLPTLRPMLPHFVPVSFFNASNAATIFNLQSWSRCEPERQALTFHNLHKSGVVSFRKDSEMVIPTLEDILTSLTSRSKLTSENHRRMLYVGFTREGGLAWEKAVGLDWSHYFTLDVIEDRKAVNAVLVVETGIIQLESSWNRNWISKQVRPIVDWDAYYWRRFEKAFNVEYVWDADEFSEFTQIFRIRGAHPMCVNL